MGDDGLLLNFELRSDAFKPKQSFKGGTWKDRLSAKKLADRRQRKSQGLFSRNSSGLGEVNSGDEELIRPDGQANKRQRLDATHNAKLRNAPDRTTQPKIAGGGVISSLFTYNPASKDVQSYSALAEEVNVEPSNAPLKPGLATFINLGLSPILANHLLNKLEIKAPTAIQKKAIEQLCKSDTDAFIQAETGSGKTLAYLLPILQRITNISKAFKDTNQSFNRDSGLFAIILAPTRELSKQINAVLESLLACCHWIVGGTVIGGEKKKSEKARLRKGLNILVATPGRLADHLEHTEVLDVSRVRWLVLDEGDRLMELGFEQDIQKIVSVLNLRSRKAFDQAIPGLPDQRTTVLCSATLMADVDQLRTIALRDAVSISATAEELQQIAGTVSAEPKFSAPAQLKQSYSIVPPKQRLVTLTALLKQTFRRKGSVAKCIVFISCADSVDFHFDILTRSNSADGGNEEAAESEIGILPKRKANGIPQGGSISESKTQALGTMISHSENPVEIFRLHGSLQQSTRTSTLKAFTKCTKASVLVCTDVASRGLDLPNIDFVIEYDPPFSKEDHLHRIGRTARAGKDGRATILLIPGCEEGYIDILKEGRPHNLTRHVASELLKKGFTGSSDGGSSYEWETRATDWQLDAERWVLENPSRQEQARTAFQSHVRAYATHIAAERNIFDMQQLHLGHLAKAFALRDKPGNIRVPGRRPDKADEVRSKEFRRSQAAKSGGRPSGDVDLHSPTDEAAARKRMQAKTRNMGGASEFNLG